MNDFVEIFIQEKREISREGVNTQLRLYWWLKNLAAMQYASRFNLSADKILEKGMTTPPKYLLPENCRHREA